MSAKLMGVDEVCEQLSVSRAYAYKVIRRLNAEMQENGCMVVPGKVSRSFFEERFFGASGGGEGGAAATAVNGKAKRCAAAKASRAAGKVGRNVG